MLLLSWYFMFQWLPWTYNYRQKIRNQIIEFREIGGKLVQERATLIQTGDEVPDDVLTTIVQNYRKNLMHYKPCCIL